MHLLIILIFRSSKPWNSDLDYTFFNIRNIWKLNFFEFTECRFQTKGEYYAHVEAKHPQTRKGYVSRMKYKIVKPLLKSLNLKTKVYRKKCMVKKSEWLSMSSTMVIQNKRSLRLYKNKLKMECQRKYSVQLDSMEFEDIPLKVFLDFPETVSVIKDQSENLRLPESVSKNSFQPILKKSSEFKFEQMEYTLTLNEESTNKYLPLKKKILKEIGANIVPVKQQLSKNTFLQSSRENLPPVEVLVDPSISCNLQSQIPIFLGAINFDMFRI